jgi:hypothetical protein
MEELLVVVAQFLFEICGEWLLQAFFEGIWELLYHLFPVPGKAARKSRRALLSGAVLFGGVSGLLSLALVPELMIHKQAWRIAALVIVPLALGGAFYGIGQFGPQRDQDRSPLDRFLYVYFFALSMSVVRFWWAD